MPQRSAMNCRTAFQLQLARARSTSVGAAWTATFSPARASAPRAGGAAGLLEGQTSGAVALEGREPAPAGVGVALQHLGHLGGGPALGQQPERVPALPLARRRGAV